MEIRGDFSLIRVAQTASKISVIFIDLGKKAHGDGGTLKNGEIFSARLCFCIQLFSLRKKQEMI